MEDSTKNLIKKIENIIYDSPDDAREYIVIVSNLYKREDIPGSKIKWIDNNNLDLPGFECYIGLNGDKVYMKFVDSVDIDNIQVYKKTKCLN